MEEWDVFLYLWNGSFNDPTNHSYWIFIINREWLLTYYGITNPTFSTSKDSFTAGNWSHTDLPSEGRHRAATKCATDFSHDLGPWEVIFRMCGTARRMCGFSFLILYDCHSHILVIHVNSYYVILWLLELYYSYYVLYYVISKIHNVFIMFMSYCTWLYHSSMVTLVTGLLATSQRSQQRWGPR